ncbi:MAG: NUDIX domain-containing protein [Oscillospiraceae bacterium]
MMFKFCPSCGAKLSLKKIGDEGDVPFCETCEKPLFDCFYTCVITAVINEFNEVALIRQSYGDTDRFVLVSGFMKADESAEEAVKREVKEELGLEVLAAKYIRSYPYPKRDNLMLGFVSKVNKANFKISCELSDAQWFSPEEAFIKLEKSKIAKLVLEDYFRKK